VAELKRLLRPRVEADTEYGRTLVELVIRRLNGPGLSERRQIRRRVFLHSGATMRNSDAGA